MMLIILCDSDDARKIVEQTVMNLMLNDGILTAPAYNAQAFYMENAAGLGIYDETIVRNVDPAAVALLFGGDESADA